MRWRTPALPRASPPSRCPAAPRGSGTVSGRSPPSGRGGLPTLSDDLLSAECPSGRPATSVHGGPSRPLLGDRRASLGRQSAPCGGTAGTEGARRGAGGGSCQHGLALPHAAPPSPPNDRRLSFLISNLTPKEIK